MGFRTRIIVVASTSCIQRIDEAKRSLCHYIRQDKDMRTDDTAYGVHAEDRVYYKHEQYQKLTLYHLLTHNHMGHITRSSCYESEVEAER
jgi:hypothetical protein